MKRLRTPILMYHHVEPRPFEPRPRFSGSYVSRAEFSDHLDWLADKSMSGRSLADALGRADRGEAGSNEVVLTFDDGCKCFLEHVVPELERRGMSATVFVVSSQVGGENAWDLDRGERIEELLSAEDLRDLAARGFEIGSHSRTHADLSQLDADALIGEVAGSKRDLEALLERQVRTFCFPYGHFDTAATRAIRDAGYLGAVSVYGISGVSPSDRMALPRAVVRPGSSRLEFKLQATGWYGLWRRLPRLGILSQLRSMRERS
ncbi:MAG: polysaccharide deacetylase family protein [Thermoanaerobaculia bacterium]